MRHVVARARFLPSVLSSFVLQVSRTVILGSGGTAGARAGVLDKPTAGAGPAAVVAAAQAPSNKFLEAAELAKRLQSMLTALATQNENDRHGMMYMH